MGFRTIQACPIFTWPPYGLFTTAWLFFITFEGWQPMESFFAYLERLEVFGFYGGYPLLFVIALIVAGPPAGRNSSKRRLIRSLPYAYALTGTCYAIMIVTGSWPQVDATLISTMQEPWLRIWALLALLFWFRPFNRIPVLSLLHSLVFFYFLVRDLLFYSVGKMDKDLIRKEMKVYGDSLLIILAALVFIYALFTLLSGYQESLHENKTRNSVR